MLMIRLILLIFLILFAAWIIRPYLRTQNGNRTKKALDRVFDSAQNNFKQQNITLIIITTVIFFAFVIWLLPKFGINFFALLQKIIPIISSLRSILPF